MTDILMTTWDGAGTTPPLMSVARALVSRGHNVRVLADPVLRAEVEATGAEHLSWTRAPHRTITGPDGDFIRDWEAGPRASAGCATSWRSVRRPPSRPTCVRSSRAGRADLVLTELLALRRLRSPPRRPVSRTWS